MRMLRWICGHTRRDQLRNDDIRDKLGVAPIQEKLVPWFAKSADSELTRPSRTKIGRCRGEFYRFLCLVVFSKENRQNRPSHGQVKAETTESTDSKFGTAAGRVLRNNCSDRAKTYLF
jgi:hypothetical protein